jgi:predicted secreted protein
MRKRGLLAVACIVALAALAWTVWVAVSRKPAPAEGGDPELDQLMARLSEPGNQVQYLGTVIPGGEMLEFSQPMKDLIRLRGRARPILHRRIEDHAIQNEVVLVLGAIGDETTVPLLIKAYPEDDVRGLAPDDPRWKNVVCFTFALTYLTGQPIGRSRWGSDCDPGNKALWSKWWREHAGGFSVPAEKPNATWVPSYP